MNSENAALSATSRRLEERYVCEIVTRCATACAAPVMALVIDVSRTGACLLASQPFAPGSRIAFELRLAGGIVHATVLHVAALSGGWFKMGCVFTQPLGTDCLDPLRKTKPDRRCDGRRPVDFLATYECQHGSGEALVADISDGGLCLLVECSFPVGATLRLRLPGDCEIEVRVVWVKDREDGAWICGCRFLRDLSAAEMSLFLDSKSDWHAEPDLAGTD